MWAARETLPSEAAAMTIRGLFIRTTIAAVVCFIANLPSPDVNFDPVGWPGTVFTAAAIVWLWIEILIRTE